jgi:hypothetical protein
VVGPDRKIGGWVPWVASGQTQIQLVTRISNTIVSASSQYNNSYTIEPIVGVFRNYFFIIFIVSQTHQMENIAYHNDPVCVPENYAIREILETWNSSCDINNNSNCIRSFTEKTYLNPPAVS